MNLEKEKLLKYEPLKNGAEKQNHRKVTRLLKDNQLIEK